MRYFLAVYVVVLLSSCGYINSESELPGRYEGRWWEKRALVILNVRADHSFSERIEATGRDIAKFDGRWSWDARQVLLSGATPPDNLAEATREPGPVDRVWTLSTETRLGKPLLVDNGTGIELRKVDNSR